jgi:hypothetical protein
MEQQTVTETPDTSFAAHLRAEEPPPATDTHVVEEQAVAVVEEPVVAEPTPEVEADSIKPDTELSEAARVLRRNRADERKAKIQREIADLVREREETRAETARLKAEREALSRGEQPRPTVGGLPTAVTDPNDPEPDPKAYPAEEYDPAYIRAVSKWEARAEFRQLEAAAAVRVRQQTVTQALASKEDAARAKFSDFDAVTDAVVADFTGNPRGITILEFVQESPLGAEVAYALGKDPAAKKEILAATGSVGVLRVLAKLEAALAEPAKPAPKHITSAPVPPSKTVGGGASALETDTRPGASTAEHIRREEAEIAARRRNGYRN